MQQEQDEKECVYSLYVKTGPIIKAGTDSNISLTLGDAEGGFVHLKNLRFWGIMGAGHDYYERDSLDIFSGRGPCIGTPVCRLVLSSDGSGSHHAWYCDYVEITSTGPRKQCSQTLFNVQQWLAKDRDPYELTVELDACDSPGTEGRFVVENRRRGTASG